MSIPPDIAREVSEWMARAREDLREAEHDLDADPPLMRGALFHCQQAAEKALKAFLTLREVPFRKTHDLDELGRLACRADQTLIPVTDRAVDLTPYAWRFRYPGIPSDPTPEEVREALAIARAVFDAVASRLPADQAVT